MRDLIDALGCVPTGCVWEITLACNMRCKHCGSAAGARRRRELTTDECFQVADDLAALGTMRVTLSGGEPLLRDDWEAIGRRLVRQGVRVNMISNGFALTERAIGLMKEAGFANVAVSLDGARETHDRIRNTPGSYDHVLRAFDACGALGFPASSVTTLFRWNLGELDHVYRTLLQHGVTLWQWQIAEPMGNMEQFREGLIPLEALPGILDLYVRFNAEGKLRLLLADCLGYYSPQEFEFVRFPDNPKLSFWTGCLAGVRVVGIRSNGDVTGCLSIRDDRFIEGNVLDTPLRELWHREGAFALNRRFDKKDLGGECASCDYGELCRGGCASMSIVLAGAPHRDPICYQLLRKKLQTPGKGAPASGGPEPVEAPPRGRA